MRLKLKENPREWQKFTAVTALLFGGIALMLRWRKVISIKVLIVVIAFLGAGLVACLILPGWFRGYYRTGRRISFAIGWVMGRALLSLFFLAVLTPFALIARISGKDLLKLKRNSNQTTYWQPAKVGEEFDREF